MFMKIVSAWKVEMRLLLRSGWTWIFLAASIVAVFVQFQTYLQWHDPGGALKSTAFIIQGGIFVSMILGLTLVKREVLSLSDEMFFVISEGYIVKVVGKWFALLTAVACFSLLSLFLLWVMYHFDHVPALFYSEAGLYIGLYWFLSFLIAGSIGMMVGLLCKTRFVLVVLVVCWLWLGPMNLAIAKPFFHLIPWLDPTPLLDFLNLGQTNPHEAFDPVYGLPLEVHRWLQKGLILSTVLFLLALAVIIKNRYRWRHRILCGGLAYLFAFLPFAFFFVQTDQVIYTGNRVNSVTAYDLLYYREHPSAGITAEIPFSIATYDLHVKSFRHLSVQLNMEIVPYSSGQKLVFTLYHDLHVESVQMGEKVLSFRQQGDQVEVIFPGAFVKGEKISLSFVYEGTSSPSFFANEQAVLLPNDFAWIPVAGSQQMMHYDDSSGLLTRPSLYPPQEAFYKLTYEGPTPLYTNLPKVGASTWQGRVSDGLMLAGGKYLTHQSIDHQQVIYPQSLYHASPVWKQFTKNLAEVCQWMEKDLSFQPSASPKYLFFVSTPEEGLSIFRDHMIWRVNQDMNEMPDQLTDRSHLVLLAVSAHFKNTNGANQDPEMEKLFAESYLYWLQLRGLIPYRDDKPQMVHSLERMQEMWKLYGDKLDEKQRNQLQTVIKRYEEVIRYMDQQKNDQEIQFFFQQYDQSLQHESILSWEKVSRFMKEKEK
jgi:hypothetical protein